MREVDITGEVNYLVRYGLIAVIAVALLSAVGVYMWRTSQQTLTIADTRIAGTAVRAKTRVAGTVRELLVADGELVKAEQALARLDVAVTPEQIAQLERILELARVNLARLEQGTPVDKPVAKRRVDPDSVEGRKAELERLESLYTIGAVSAQHVEKARAAYEESRRGLPGGIAYETVVQPASAQALQRARVQVQQAEASLNAARATAATTAITAPVSGCVYLTDAKVGSEVVAGQTIVYVAGADSLWLEAYTDPKYKARLALGQFATYRIDGKDYQGTIVDLADPIGKAEQPVRDVEAGRPVDKRVDKLTVRISLPREWNAHIRPDSKVTVTLRLN